MNIVYLVGNGFDLNLGMKTTYSDFYKYYSAAVSPNTSVKKLKNSIKDNKENWSDLELALGEYTKKISSLTEIDEIYEDLTENLSKYLEKEERKLNFNAISSEKIYEYLAFPENHLLQADKDKLITHKGLFHQQVFNIDIITFNYTKSLEKILKSKDKKDSVNIKSINHVHGDTKNGMLIGVNDKSQITNETFHDDEDFLDLIMKPKANHVQKHNVDIQCKEKIQKADLICVFGSSIGVTDKMWWELIGTTLFNKNHLRLIIFTKGKAIPNIQAHKIGRKEREIRDLFLDKTTLKEKNAIINKIFIGYNTQMFNFDHDGKGKNE